MIARIERTAAVREAAPGLPGAASYYTAPRDAN